MLCHDITALPLLNSDDFSIFPRSSNVLCPRSHSPNNYASSFLRRHHPVRHDTRPHTNAQPHTNQHTTRKDRTMSCAYHSASCRECIKLNAYKDKMYKRAILGNKAPALNIRSQSGPRRAVIVRTAGRAMIATIIAGAAICAGHCRVAAHRVVTTMSSPRMVRN